MPINIYLVDESHGMSENDLRAKACYDSFKETGHVCAGCNFQFNPYCHMLADCYVTLKKLISNMRGTCPR